MILSSDTGAEDDKPIQYPPKSGDVSIPFRPVQTEVKWLFHAQKMEMGRDRGWQRASDRKDSQLFQS